MALAILSDKVDRTFPRICLSIGTTAGLLSAVSIDFDPVNRNILLSQRTEYRHELAKHKSPMFSELRTALVE